MKTTTFFYRFTAGVLSMTIPLMQLPVWAFATTPKPYGPSQSLTTPHQPSQNAMKPSRLIGEVEAETIRGKTAGMVDANPYLAGTNKWDVVHNGMNLLTGNFTTSATDLSFEGGYGIPVNLTRSYSVNNPDEGPFGYGWTMSCDIRSTAGGALKSSSAPIRSVPVNIKQRPKLQDDPALPSSLEPVEAAVTTDAAGAETTVSRDVDGILTTPPWEKNEVENTYELVVQSSTTYEVLVTSKVTTPEGTVYVYTKHGSYGSQYKINDPGGTTAPSNILKIDTVTDRHGITTNYYYTSDPGDLVSFFKYNGTATEDRLTSISMPGGREIEFTWTSNRITSATDGTRTVDYAYTSGMLTSVMSPADRETKYRYNTTGDTLGGALNSFDDMPTPNGESNNTKLLTEIEDCRELVTKIYYCLSEDIPVWPYAAIVSGIVAYHVDLPNGVHSCIKNFGPDEEWPDDSCFPCGGGEESKLEAKDTEPDAESWTAHEVTYIDRAGAHHTGDLYEAGEVRVQSWSTALVVIGAHLEDRQNVVNPENKWTKKYDLETYNCFEELKEVEIDWLPVGIGGKSEERDFPISSEISSQSVKVETEFNCFGNPLRKAVTETNTPDDSLNRTAEVEYAYWGADKYYQQRSVRTKTGSSAYRYSFTDYFDNATGTPAGKRGQTKRVWGPNVYGTPQNVTSIDPPAGTSTDDYWKYRYFPQYYGTSTYGRDAASAEFDYDSVGRPSDVYKLPKTGPSNTYIRTNTTYYGSGAGQFGLPLTVTEAMGLSEERETTTNEYDAIGRAKIVTDALGREFTTTYNADGQILEVEKTDGPGGEGSLVVYQYGTSGTSNAMVTSVFDVQSVREQTYLYYPKTAHNGHYGRAGQVQQVTDLYHVGDPPETVQTAVYDYMNTGDRLSVLLETPNGETKWRYGDYTFAGFAGSFSRVFQTLNKQVKSGSNWVDTTDEFHYNFDCTGRLTHTAFAQFPDYDSEANPTTATAYTSDRLAERRILQWTKYDAAGRVDWTKAVSQTQQFSGGQFVGMQTVGNFYLNEPSYTNFLGLKSSSYNKHWNAAGSNIGEWTENYGYDANLDYLTDVDYNNSHPGGETFAWTYDWAGNRSNSGYAYDNLNRMTASPGSMSYENDEVGNRTGRNMTVNNSPDAIKYEWDLTNRMTMTVNTASGYRNEFRADGMRVKKVAGFNLSWEWLDKAHTSGFYDEVTATNLPTTRYYYDGQMPVEEDFTSNSVYTYKKYGLGLRGIEVIQDYNSSDVLTSELFPVYDAHGNMALCLARTGNSQSGAWTDSQHKSYDVWGQTRWNGSASSAVKQRYCASLGHIEDDESGLQYMRSRFYEPWTGRFVNQDPAGDGANWFVYCSNSPVSKVDPSGLFELEDVATASTSGEAIDAAASSTVAHVLKGKVTQIVLYLETQWQLGLISGYGVSRAGEFAWRFTSSQGYQYLIRFNINEGILKFNALLTPGLGRGPNLGHNHHNNLQKFLQECVDWATENGL